MPRIPYVPTTAARAYLADTAETYDDTTATPITRAARRALVEVLFHTPANVAHYAVEDAAQALMVLLRADARAPIGAPVERADLVQV